MSHHTGLESTVTITWFLDFVHCLKLKKEHKVWELDLFPSSAKDLGGTYSVGPNSITCT